MNAYDVIIVIQPLAKLMVGAIQSYIILELGIRIGSGRKTLEEQKSMDRRLKIVKIVLAICTVAGFLAFCVQ